MKEMLGNLPQFQEMKAKVKYIIDLFNVTEQSFVVFSTFKHCPRVSVRF